MNKLVLLVAGHGGGDPGAVGQGSQESIETIQLCHRVYDLLAPHPNIIVVETPDELDFVASTAWINNNGYQLNDGLTVEIHKNAFNSQATGIEILVPGGADSASMKQANDVLKAMCANTGLVSRGVKVRGDLYLINNVNTYAILVEAGFIDHDSINDDMDAKMALGIAQGLCQYFGETLNVTVPAPTPIPAPAPTPVATPTINYRVYVTGVQVGAYTADKNAWLKYVSTGRVGVIKNAGGTDVTAAVLASYEPVVVPPVVVPPVIQVPPVVPVTPVPDTSDVVTKSALMALWAAVWTIIINFFKGGKK